MMGGLMEVGTHLGIGVKLTISSPSDAYWDGYDVRQHFKHR
jgi:hypothetical protein